MQKFATTYNLTFHLQIKISECTLHICQPIRFLILSCFCRSASSSDTTIEDSTALIPMLPQSVSNNLGSPLFRGNSFDLIASSVAAPFGADLMSFPSFAAAGSCAAPSSTAITSNPALGGPLTRMHSLDPYSGFNLTGAVPGDIIPQGMFLDERGTAGKRSMNEVDSSATEDQPKKIIKVEAALGPPISASGNSISVCSFLCCHN